MTKKDGLLTLTFACVLMSTSGCDRDTSTEHASGDAPADGHRAGLGDDSEEVAVKVKTQNSPMVAAATSGPTASALGQKPLLDSEARLMQGGVLSAKLIAPIIKDERSFQKLKEQIAREAATDPLAQDMTAEQTKAFTSRLDGKADLRDLVCGLSVCVGSADWGQNSRGPDEFANAFLSDPKMSGYSLIDYKVDLGKNNFQQRFVLSVDPAAGGVVVPTNHR